MVVNVETNVMPQVIGTKNPQYDLIHSGVFKGLGEKLFKFSQKELKTHKCLKDNGNNYEALFKLIYSKKIRDTSMMIKSI